MNIYEKIGDVVRDDDAAKVICRCCGRRVDGRFECNACGTEPLDVADDVFGDFGSKEIVAVSKSMDDICKEFKHIGCLVELDENDRPKVTVSLLSWVNSGCIISLRVAKRLSKIVSEVTGRDYRWHGTGESVVIKEVCVEEVYVR